MSQVMLIMIRIHSALLLITGLGLVLSLGAIAPAQAEPTPSCPTNLRRPARLPKLSRAEVFWLRATVLAGSTRACSSLLPLQNRHTGLRELERSRISSVGGLE